MLVYVFVWVSLAGNNSFVIFLGEISRKTCRKVATGAASYLHGDQLGSVRVV